MNNNDNTTNAQPAFDGECAFAVSLGKSGVEGTAKTTLVVSDTTYHFSNPVAKMLFRVLPNRAAKADAAWALRPNPS
jgi:hypothetical protein